MSWSYDSIVTDDTEVCTTDDDGFESCALKAGEIYYLDGVSADDLTLNASSVSDYDDDSWFFGIIDYRPNTYGTGGQSDNMAWVKILH